MLKALFIYLSKARWARQIVTRWGFARRAAGRFIAGDTLDEAITSVRALNARGFNVTLDHLGENVSALSDALRATDDYLVLIDRICGADVRANVSLKLTQLGLLQDLQACQDNLSCVVHKAQACGGFVRIDIEDSSTTDRTWQVYRGLRSQGLDNVGVAVQSYLYRSVDDVKKLLDDGARIRLVKGAYSEPANLAFPLKKDVDANFDALSRMIIDAALAAGSRPVSADGRVPPMMAIASHDPARVEAARAYAERVGLPKSALEFQMLYGIRQDLQEKLAAAGYPVRVYVPYGTEWYPYFVRRLAERPANVWFFLEHLVRG
ncbi:MAG TPA: proline dehydrogenase family protein [Anaerolineales bacterium]|nr:proline dehydrogenase family protein [Anaerolineales bacterium]